MPIKSWIEKDKKRVSSIVSGTITIEEIFETINDAVNDPDFEPGYDILSDHTGIDEAITSDQLQMTVDHLKTLSTHFSGSKWAVATVMDLSYGMMRMFSALIQNIPIEMQVFKTVEEAEDWLES